MAANRGPDLCHCGFRIGSSRKRLFEDQPAVHCRATELRLADADIYTNKKMVFGSK
jgi:hypothetical protein